MQLNWATKRHVLSSRYRQSWPSSTGNDRPLYPACPSTASPRLYTTTESPMTGALTLTPADINELRAAAEAAATAAAVSATNSAVCGDSSTGDDYGGDGNRLGRIQFRLIYEFQV